MPAMRECPRCRTPLNNDAPDGFCPACMLEGALDLGDQSNPKDESSSPFAARRIGDYELLEEIARGGMGVVYRARQLSLDRIVALKLILLGQFADDASIRRFKAEAAAAARLRHPNIVTIHEIGADAGQHYFSMEYVEGQSLADHAREHPVAVAQAAQWVQIIAEAVNYAHTLGIIHRDLKPSNILIDCFSAPHITDFGLARDLKSNSELTLTGQVLGSPNYISPEQASGSQASALSDIYSLGAILYHLLCGRPPFTADTITKTLQLVATEEPISPRILNPSVPRDLETICLRCLEKEPDKRYATAADLADELSRFLKDEPIRARAVSAPEKAWRWCRRKPVVASLITAFSLSLLLGFCGVTWQWRRAEQRAEESRYREYISDMLRAQNALTAENIGQAREILLKHIPQPGQKDLRNWEWDYAWNQSQSDESFSFGGALPYVFSIAVANDGNLLAIGGMSTNGPIIILWEIKKRKELARLNIHKIISDYTVAFSSDDKQLFHGMEDGTLLAWDLETRRPQVLLTNLTNVRSLKVSPDGKLLAIYAHAGLTLWRLTPFVQVAVFPNTASTDNLPAGVAFSPDSTKLAFALKGGPIMHWDLLTTNETALLEGHESNVTGIVFSPDAATLVSGSRDGTLRVWDVKSGRVHKQIQVSSAFLSTLASSPDGNFIAVGGAAQNIRLYDTKSWQLVKTLKGHGKGVTSLAFSTDGNHLISGSKDGTVKFWSPESKSQPLSVRLPADLNSLELLEGGRTLSLAYTNATHAWWDTDPVRQASDKTQTKEGPTRISPDRKILAAATTNGLKILEYPTGRVITNFALTYSGGGSLLFSRDGQSLAAIGYDHRCHVFRLNRHEPIVSPLASFPLRTNSITTLKFSSDGGLLGIVYWFATVEIWNVSSFQRTLIQTNYSQMTDIAITRDGTTALISGGAGDLRVWDLKRRQQVTVLGGQLGTLWSVELSPDESRFAACGGDGAVRIWDRSTLQEVAYLKIYTQPLGQLAFSETGETLFVTAFSEMGGQNVLFTLRAPKAPRIR